MAHARSHLRKTSAPDQYTPCLQQGSIAREPNPALESESLPRSFWKLAWKPRLAYSRPARDRLELAPCTRAIGASRTTIVFFACCNNPPRIGDHMATNWATYILGHSWTGTDHKRPSRELHGDPSAREPTPRATARTRLSRPRSARVTSALALAEALLASNHGDVATGARGSFTPGTADARPPPAPSLDGTPPRRSSPAAVGRASIVDRPDRRCDRRTLMHRGQAPITIHRTRGACPRSASSPAPPSARLPGSHAPRRSPSPPPRRPPAPPSRRDTCAAPSPR